MPAGKRRGHILKSFALLITAGLAVSVVYVHHRAATLLSGVLAGRLGLPVSISLVDIGAYSGVTLYNLRVENPPGYPAQNLVEIPAIGIMPDYGELVHGRISIKRVRITRPAVYILKDRKGVWNVQRALDSYREKNPKTGRPEKPFALGELSVLGGAAHVSGLPEPVDIKTFFLNGLANTGTEPSTFEFGAGYTKGVYIAGGGKVAPLTGPPGIDGRVAVRVDGIGEHVKAPDYVELKDAVLDSTATIGLKDGVLDCVLDASVHGVRTKWEQDREISAGLNVVAEYDTRAGRAEVKSARLTMPDMPAVAVKGRIADVKTSGVGDISLDIAGFDLRALKYFMPKGIAASGKVQPVHVEIKGPLRPFNARAVGSVEVVGAGIEYAGAKLSGMDISAGFGYSKGTGLEANVKLERGNAVYRAAKLDGITGTAGLKYPAVGVMRLDADVSCTDAAYGDNDIGRVKLTAGAVKGRAGALAAEAAVEFPAGRITGNGSYENGSGIFEAVAEGVDIGRIKAQDKVDSGEIYLKIAGKYKIKPVSVQSGYDVSARGLGSSDGKYGADSVATKGTLDFSGGRPTVNGGLKADGLTFSGRKGSLSADYAWDGRLYVTDAAYTDKDFTARFAKLDAGYRKGSLDAVISGGQAAYRDRLATLTGIGGKVAAKISDGGRLESAGASLRVDGAEAYGLDAGPVSADASLDGEAVSVTAVAEISGNPLKIKAAGIYRPRENLIKPALSGNLYVKDFSAFQDVMQKRFNGKYSLTGGSGAVEVSLAGETLDGLEGNGHIKLDGLGVGLGGGREVKAVSAELRPVYSDGKLTLPPSGIDFGGYFRVGVSGEASRGDGGWSAKATLDIPETDALSIQEGVLEALPPSLMWADVAGKTGGRIDVTRSAAGVLKVAGSIDLDGVTLDIPDKGVHVGPVDGRLPVGFASGGKRPPPPPPFRGERFDRERYPALARAYSAVPRDADIVIEKLRYGFVEFDALTLDLEPGEGYYDIKWFGVWAFDGQLYGYGSVDLSGESSHTLSLIVSGISLRAVCDSAPTIKGYLDGKVDGLSRVTVSGGRLEDIAGAALFWTKDAPGEDRAISKSFIKKLMGPSMKKYMFIGDRNFDKGELEVVFLEGDLVFENLLIENTNFIGQRDLYITVAPVSNRISISHLLDVIKDVGERAKK